MKFCIKVDGNENEIRRILTILFNNGYVFYIDRLKNTELILKRWKVNCRWKYIIVGHDGECKAVVAITENLSDVTHNVNSFTNITVESLIALNDEMIGYNL